MGAKDRKERHAQRLNMDPDVRSSGQEFSNRDSNGAKLRRGSVSKFQDGMPNEASDAFIDSLPSDDFTVGEELLREAILDLLDLKGQQTVEQVLAAQHVGAQAMQLLPATNRLVCFADWIERRIGGELELVRSDQVKLQKTLVRRIGDTAPPPAPPEPKKARKQGSSDDWFATLPHDSFRWEESSLRERMFDFLAEWRLPECAMLWHLEGDPVLRDLCRQFLPPGITLIEWIDKRIGAEVEVTQDGSIHLRGGAELIVQRKYMEVEQRLRYHPQPRGLGDREPPRAPPRASPQGPSNAGSKEIPPKVMPIWKALDRVRQQQPELFQGGLTFSELKRVMDSSSERFNLGELSAISKEMGSKDGSPAMVVREFCSDIVKLVSAKNQKKGETSKPDKRREEQAKPAESSQPSIPKDQHVAPAMVLEPEDLWAKLPVGKMWAQETRLRGALLRWMYHQEEEGLSDSMPLEDAAVDDEIKKVSRTLLEKYNAELQEWIERRLPDDISVGLDEHDRPVLFALVPLEEEIAKLEEQKTESRTGAKKASSEQVPADLTHGDESLGDADGAEERNLCLTHADGARLRNKEKGREKFIDCLPPDELLRTELALAEKLATFDGVTLSAAQMKVQHAKNELLNEALGPKHSSQFPFKLWIEQRIADFVCLESVNGQPTIRATGGGGGGGGQKRPSESEGSPDKRARLE